MSTILLADDSPHAQRMGERILREEGFSVASVTDGETALLRMSDVDPDLVIADVFLPGQNGFEICRSIKASNRHVRVVLTAGLLETFDEEEARRAGCDAILKKPFEASLVMETLRPLIRDAQLARGLFAEVLAGAQPIGPSAAPSVSPAINPARPPLPVSASIPDPERVEAAITLALDAALPALVREITEKVLVALGH
jgi:CheY-like chemotaxis protein